MKLEIKPTRETFEDITIGDKFQHPETKATYTVERFSANGRMVFCGDSESEKWDSWFHSENVLPWINSYNTIKQ